MIMVIRMHDDHLGGGHVHQVKVSKFQIGPDRIIYASVILYTSIYLTNYHQDEYFFCTKKTSSQLYM